LIALLPILLLFAAAAAAVDPQELSAQRLAVERAAATVAQARFEGARRGELAELMAAYRVQAEALAALEAQLAPSLDEQVRARRGAVNALSEALATGGAAPEALAILEAWLGEPALRLEALQGAVLAAEGTRDAELRRDLLLDVLDQCDGLALLATHRSLEAEALEDRLELRTLALERRNAPGQSGSIEDTVQVLRLREQALEAERTEERWAGWRAQALALRERTSSLLREER